MPAKAIPKSEIKNQKSKIIRLGHSPDPDDAFMWYPLADFVAPDGTRASPQIDTGGFRFEHVLQDIQTLNERAQRGELEVTAISIHQYAHVADKYALTSCGASMGDGYGPMIVSPRSRKLSVGSLDSVRIAVPGRRTSAFLALSLFLGTDKFPHEVVPFDEIIPQVLAGKFDAGLIIHEGQLTYSGQGLDCLVDLGKWWTGLYDLPLPLGGNAIRRDLGPDTMSKVCTVLRASIDWALAHREESLKFALQFGRGLTRATADQFVGMYVNQFTLDYGDRGRAAVQQFLSAGAKAGFIPDVGEIDFVEPLAE